MIRSGHVLYDLRQLLDSTKLMVGVLVATAIFVLLVDLQCLYGFVLLFIVLVTVRGVIGRRCPQCDGSLQEVEAERDKTDVMVMYVIWRCPKDGYEEKEKIKGDSGLFGAR